MTMTDERFAAVLAEGATRAAALPPPEREKAFEELRLTAVRVGEECGYTAAASETFADDLIATLREVMAGLGADARRLLH